MSWMEISTLHVEQTKITTPSNLWRPVICFPEFTGLLKEFLNDAKSTLHIFKLCKIPAYSEYKNTMC